MSAFSIRVVCSSSTGWRNNAESLRAHTYLVSVLDRCAEAIFGLAAAVFRVIRSTDGLPTISHEC
jgi:hypothetical protein